MTLYIGIDLSTEPANTGIAVLHDNDENIPQIHEVNDRWCGTVLEWQISFGLENPINNEHSFVYKANRIVEILDRIANGNQNVIIAIDVPFGWPMEFCAAMAGRLPGQAQRLPGQAIIDVPANDITLALKKLFYRYTERLMMRPPQGMRPPLSVSTDKIGRTAMLGSFILQGLRDYEIQKQTRIITPLKIIEVYPTATAFALADEIRRFSLKGFYRRVGLALRRADPTDRYDAVVAAYTAYMTELIAGPEMDFFTRQPDPDDQLDENVVNSEGWIWAPHRGNISAQQRQLHREQIGYLLQQAFPRP